MTDSRTLTKEQLLHLVDRARRGSILAPELDDLHAGITAMAARITTLEHVAAGNKRHVQLIVPELEQAERVAQSAARDAATALTAQLTAEAAIERVRNLAERWRHTGDRKGSPLRELLTALDEQQPTT